MNFPHFFPHSFPGRFEKGGHKGLGGIQKVPVLSGVVFSLSGVISWFESVMAALECHNWVFEEQLLALSELFKGINSTVFVACKYSQMLYEMQGTPV